MRTIEYTDREIRVGMQLLVNGEVLTVEHVYWRMGTFGRSGRGLAVYTRKGNGYLGPVIYPHPDEMVQAVYAPPVEEIPEYLYTSDYPYAVVR